LSHLLSLLKSPFKKFKRFKKKPNSFKCGKLKSLKQIGIDDINSGPSSKLPDQKNPQKYFSHNNKHVSFVTGNTLFYKDFNHLCP